MNNPFPYFFSILLFFSTSFAENVKDNDTDKIGRFINYSLKTEVSCPKQDKDVAVILIIGQSNSANHGEKKFITHYPEQVLNYFEGKCYIASSPLLGSTGVIGEFITPMADKLIENRDYKKIVLIAFGITGTTIKEWEKNGYFNNMLQSILDGVRGKYSITDVIWHQGESDFATHNTTEKYQSSFYSLVQSLRKANELSPNIYYAIATKCGDNPGWEPINPISIAQRSLENANLNIFLGANTDELLSREDRDLAHCHFSESGQIKTANAFASSIHLHHSTI